MPFLSTDDSHTTLHEPIPFSEVSAPYEHNFAPQAGPLPGGAAPDNAQARDLEVYNDLIARGFHTAQFVWNNDGQITRIHDFSTLSGVLDVSGLTALTSLHVQNSPLTELNVSGCTALTSLHVQDTPLTELNVSGCTALASLHVQDTPLTELNVSDFTELTVLRVPNNLLTELDVSSNTALTTLEVWRNQLTELDASGLANLRELNASQNQLTSLDMSGCTALMMLNVSYNQLTALDVSSNTALTVVGGNNNQLMFSTLKLPSHTVTNSNFSGQAAVPITLKPGNTVDLASENVAGMTSYTWHYSDGTTVNSSLYTEAGGVFTFHGLSDDTVTYVSMTNAGFPGMTLQTTQVTIVGETVELTSIIPNTNSPQVGDTITTTLTPSGATATYQWFRGDTAIAGATSSSYTVITADIGYALRVVATGTGEYTGMVSHTLTNAVQHIETKLGNPTILSATGSESTLTITWTVDPAAKSYVVEWLNGQDWVTTGVGTTSNGTATITGNFAAGATYFVHVIAKAENEENDSEPEMVTIIIGSAPDPLQPIVTVASVTNNSITLFWPAIAANTDYEIIITSGNEPAGMTIVKSATGAMINGLNPDTNYSFNVIALNTNGIAADAVDVHAKTTNVDDTPIASPTVTIENGVSTSLKVNLPIGTSNENVDVYVIRYWHVDGNNTYHADPIRVNAGTSFVLLTGLKANTQYIITVEAIGKVGFGNATTIVDAPLTSAEVPANVAAVKAAGVKMANAKSATPPTISSITLTWRAQHESITYTIGARDRINSNTSGTIAGTVGTLAVLNQKNFTWLYNERNEIIGVTITGLKAGTRYDFTVTAKDINGNEVLKRNSGVPDSVNVRASTLTPRQAAVKASAVRTSASIDSVSIRWNVPTSGIDGYQIRMLGTNANGVRNQHLATIVINGSGVGNIATITSVVPMPNSGLNEALLMQPSIVFETLRPNTARAVDTMTLKVEGLKAKMSYRFEIQTTGQCAAGDFISTVSRVSASTLNWPAVRSIKLDTRTASSVNLNWTLPRYTTAFPAAADPVTHYQIWLAASAGSPVVLLDTIDARVNNTLITNATITLTEVQRTEIGNRFENSCRLVIRAVVMDGDTILNQSADAMVALRAV